MRKLHEQVESMMLTEMHKEEAPASTPRGALLHNRRALPARRADRQGAARSSTPPTPRCSSCPTSSRRSWPEVDWDCSKEERNEAPPGNPGPVRRAQRAHPQRDQLLKAYCLYEKDVDYVVHGPATGNAHVLHRRRVHRPHPAGKAAGPTACTRRRSQGTASRSSARPRRSPPSPSRTTSASTRKARGHDGHRRDRGGEFNDIYKLDVVVIPTNRPVRRVDANDLMFRTQREKFKAIIDDVAEIHRRRGQPVLLGTVSRRDLRDAQSQLLREAGHPGQRAERQEPRPRSRDRRQRRQGRRRHHRHQHGRPRHGHQARRGVVLGATDSVVLSQTCQLDEKMPRRLEDAAPAPRGKALRPPRHRLRAPRVAPHRPPAARPLLPPGRPPAPRASTSRSKTSSCASSAPIASPASWAASACRKGKPIEHRWLNRSVETAQRRVEQHNFSIRKRTLEYDDVMNKQREVVYTFRSEILRSRRRHGAILDVFNDLVASRSARPSFMTSERDGVAPRRPRRMGALAILPDRGVGAEETQALRRQARGSPPSFLFARVEGGLRS
jgi:preprotein translocase subunit SecA